MARKHNAFCAFCRTPRKVYRHRGIRFFHVLVSLLTGLIFTLAIFQELDPRGIVFFILALAIAEIFLRVRWRIHIVCRQCGFDPVIYLKHPEEAAARVKSFLEHRRTSAEFLLSPSLNLPTISAQSSMDKLSQAKKGKLLSHRI